MSNKEDEELFRNLSRKELQSLCKQCGLPARKASSQMVDSLIFYFKRKGLSLVSSSTSEDGIQQDLLHMSSVPTMQPEAPLNSVKDSFGLRSCPREDINKVNGNLKSNKLQESFGGFINNFQGALPFHFVSECAGNHMNHNNPLVGIGSRIEDEPQFQYTDVNNVTFPGGNSSHMRTTTNAPASFEFYVSSQEGIKLCVDLNSSPTEWSKKYKNQVSLCENMSDAKSRSLHQELGCIGENNKKMKSSFLQNMVSDPIMDVHQQAEPSPNLIMENKIHEWNGHPDGGNKSLISSPLISCAINVDMPESEEDQGHGSIKPGSDVQNQIACNTKSGFKKDCTAVLDSDVTGTPLEKTACNFAVNSISDGSVDLIVLEHQNSKNDDEVCENSALQNSYNLENTSVVFPGCFMEMQLSEAGNYQKDASCSPHIKGKFLDPYDSKHKIESEQDAIAISSENGPSGNHLPTCSEDQEWSNMINGRESSVCSQVHDSSMNTCSKLGNAKSNGGLHRKRPHIDKESQNGRGKHDVKILKSMKHSAEVLPRRSMRLVSKVLSRHITFGL